MEIASSAVPEDARRAWLVLKVQAVLHAVLGLVIGVGSLYARTNFRMDPVTATAVQGVLLVAWLLTLMILRRKSMRLKEEIPPPTPRRRSLMLGALPCLQLLGLAFPPILPNADAVYGVLGLSSLLLFVIIVLSGVCFALASVPIRWGAWGLALGSSLTTGLLLLAVALRQMHWTC